jgi:hypothetical protein
MLKLEYEKALEKALEEHPEATYQLTKLDHSVREEIDQATLLTQKQQPTGPIRGWEPVRLHEQIYEKAIKEGIPNSVKDGKDFTAKEDLEIKMNDHSRNGKDIAIASPETLDQIERNREERSQQNGNGREEKKAEPQKGLEVRDEKAEIDQPTLESKIEESTENLNATQRYMMQLKSTYEDFGLDKDGKEKSDVEPPSNETGPQMSMSQRFSMQLKENIYEPEISEPDKESPEKDLGEDWDRDRD